MLPRILQLHELLKKKSFFLFGPRATGKTSLVRMQLDENVAIINLLRGEHYLRLNSQPQLLESMISAYSNPKVVVIDEIQRIPTLLNEVHYLIEEKNIHFLLTGSSARKLKKADVNLLGGRAWTADLFPLTSSEIPQFDLERYLRFGGLPPVYLSDDPDEELHAYVNTYLKEEITAEAVVRKIPAFSRFLQTSALTSGHILNFTEIASDSGIAVSTIREYYQILEDTFLGFLVPGWTKTKKRKALSTAKFYYFDLGVKNTLAGIKSIDPQSDLFGQAFEHFIALELRAYLSYKRIKKSLSYWRSTNGIEVDFIIGDEFAIEVKSSNKISDKHLKGLRCLSEEKLCQHYYVVSQDKINRVEDQIHIIYWQDFLNLLWNDQLPV